jgi:uncharacterized protein YaaN involved in tellurite resistance
MADYDAEQFGLTFTYVEWQQIHESLKKRRDDLHNRADFLELEQPTETGQIQGLRRKASGLYELMESIRDGMAAARRQNADSRR